MFSKKIIKTIYEKISKSRRYSSVFEDIKVPNDDKSNKIRKNSMIYKKSVSIASEVKELLTQNDGEYLIPYIPKRLMRRSYKGRPSVYLINPQNASKIISMISEDLLKNPTNIIETNPGTGLLTELLLKLDIPKLTVFEKGEQFLLPQSPLGKLLELHPRRLTCKLLDFFDIWLLMLRDKFCYENVSEIYLEDIKPRAWEDKNSMQIIGFCADRRFLTFMIHNFAFQTSIFEYGRPACYLAVPYDIWDRSVHFDIKNHRYYSNFQVFLNLFFDYKKYGTFSRKDFLPWPVKLNAKIDQLDIPYSLLRIEPKVDAFSILDKIHLQSFWYFLKYGLKARKQRVITELEKIIPDCGPRLIRQNIDICTTFKELEPQKLLDLFKNLKTWPEYDPNLFSPTTAELIDEFKKDDEKEESECENPKASNE